MEADEAIKLTEDAYRSPSLRQVLVGALRQAYDDSLTRAEDYGPWQLAKWGVPHDRRAAVDGQLYRVAREMPDANPVMVDNHRRSYTFLCMQIDRVLMVAARTPSPRKLPRNADMRVRLARMAERAQSLQTAFLEELSVGYDVSAGAPLLTILAHGPVRGMPCELGWARVLVPDHRYQSIVHVIDLLRRSDKDGEFDLPTLQTAQPDMPPHRPRLRRQGDIRKEGS